MNLRLLTVIGNTFESAGALAHQIQANMSSCDRPQYASYLVYLFEDILADFGTKRCAFCVLAWIPSIPLTDL